MEKKPILFLENIDKAFKTSDGDFYALKNINLSFPNKGLHCLVGKSGSGKSTLLNLLLQIEKPTKGEIFYKNKKISKFKKKDLNNYRNCVIGTIFQHYNLFEDLSVIDNIICKEIYRASNVEFSPKALEQIELYTKMGYGNTPICMAKTPQSLSDDPKRVGAPIGSTIHIREINLSSGAGFVVPLSGSILTMPGLPKVPAAVKMEDE